MATKKPAAKAAPQKQALKKPQSMPVKKAALVKKAVKPVPKLTAGKTVITSSKPLPKSVAKKAAKPAPKPIPQKVVKPITKGAPKVLKPVAKPITKKVAVASKPAQKIPDLKKTSVKTPAPIPEKTSKAPSKQASAPKVIAKNAKEIKITPAKAVVIPKINTKTSRKYSPDFTKSVLDQVKNDPGAPIVRYSDSDLMEFKELIQRKLGAAKKELSYLQGLITRKDEMGGDESDNRYMTMEDGSLSMEREQLSQMASRQITFIDHLEKALMRIENQTYGICRVTGKLIDKARLRAVPHATLSIEAKMGMVK